MYLFHFCDWYHKKVAKIPIKTCIFECLFSTIQFCEKLKIATCIFSLITPQQIMLQKSYAPRWKAVNISFPTAYAFFLSNDPFLRYKPLNQSHFFKSDSRRRYTGHYPKKDHFKQQQFLV